MQNGMATGEDGLAVPYKTKHTLCHDSAIAYPGIYPNGLKTHIYAQTSTQLFTAVLFIIAKTWKPPRCPSGGEWRNRDTSRQWSIIQCKKEMCYEAPKIGRILKHRLRKSSQSEKAPYCMISTIWYSGKGKIMKTAERSVVAMGSGEGRTNRGAQRTLRAMSLFCMVLSYWIHLPRPTECKPQTLGNCDAST